MAIFNGFLRAGFSGPMMAPMVQEIIWEIVPEPTPVAAPVTDYPTSSSEIKPDGSTRYDTLFPLVSATVLDVTSDDPDLASITSWPSSLWQFPSLQQLYRPGCDLRWPGSAFHHILAFLSLAVSMAPAALPSWMWPQMTWLWLPSHLGLPLWQFPSLQQLYRPGCDLRWPGSGFHHILAFHSLAVSMAPAALASWMWPQTTWLWLPSHLGLPLWQFPCLQQLYRPGCDLRWPGSGFHHILAFHSLAVSMAPAGLPASTVLVAPLINAASDLAPAAHGPAPAASGRGSCSPTHKSYSSQWTAMKYFRPDSV